MTQTQTTKRDYSGYDLCDNAGNKIGTVQATWFDMDSNEPEFVAVKTGWLMGANHFVPLQNAQIDDSHNTITAGYSEDKIKDAPSFDADADLTAQNENDIYGYYGVQRSLSQSDTGLPSSSSQNNDFSRGMVGDGAGHLQKVASTQTDNYGTSTSSPGDDTSS